MPYHSYFTHLMLKNPVILNLLYVLAIGLNIVFLRYFSLHIEPLNNNGVRFTVGAIVLIAFVFGRFRQEFLNVIKTPQLLGFAVLVGVMMCANMFFWLKGAAVTSSLTAAIAGVLAMPFGVLIAALFFQDEREKIRHWQFWFGCILTIVGALGFVWYGQEIAIGDGFLLGAFFLLCSILIRNVQNLVVKFVNNKLNVFVLSFYTSLTTGILSLFISQQAGKIEQLFTIPTWLLLSLMAIGIYAILAGMVLTFHVIQKQGLVTYQILELLMPVSAGGIAYLILGESLSVLQLFFAFVVICGAGIALRVFPKRK